MIALHNQYHALLVEKAHKFYLTRFFKRIIWFIGVEKLVVREKSLYHTKIPTNKLLQAIFCMLTDMSYRQLYFLFGFSDSTIARLKSRLLNCYKKILNERPVFLGGINRPIEADETVLSRKGIKRNPTSFDDVTRSTVWILGAFEREINKIFGSSLFFSPGGKNRLDIKSFYIVTNLQKYKIEYTKHI
jgi:hypothetical protein